MEVDFDDIRPYRDHEVSGIMKRLAESPDFYQGIKFFMGQGTSQGNREDNILNSLKKQLLEIRTVKEFQEKIVIRLMLQPVIDNTIDELTCSGLENLSADENYLFISNHRDITLDPALANYHLHKNGFDTLEIAFGDNLLINNFISDLIRVNRSFIVKRDLPIVEQLKESIKLSKYIEYTLSEGNSVWIAQREGRAKDGNDFTNPAIIKMLHLSQRERGMELADYIKKLNIVPISISYEYDPCDRLKGLELFKKKKEELPGKSKRDDLVSMNLGIKGYKGRVHLSFGKPLKKELTSEKETALYLDREIQLNYRLWPSNYIAFDVLNRSGKYSGKYDQEEKNRFLERYKRLQPELQLIILEGYANPVKNYEKQEASI